MLVPCGIAKCDIIVEDYVEDLSYLFNTLPSILTISIQCEDDYNIPIGIVIKEKSIISDDNKSIISELEFYSKTEFENSIEGKYSDKLIVSNLSNVIAENLRDFQEIKVKNSYLFKPLETEIINNTIARIGIGKNVSIEVVLLDGELIFGDLSWQTYENYIHLIPVNDLPIDVCCSLEFSKPKNGWEIEDNILLQFNSVNGKIYGDSNVIKIDKKFITGIRSFSLLSDLSISNIPNPDAVSIYNNNVKIASKYALGISNYIEMALSEESIPSEGINFKDDEIIYTDWNFINRIAGGINSVGVSIYGLGASYGKQKSLDDFAMQKLRCETYERIKHVLKGKKKEYNFEGYLIVPQSIETTNIDGENCRLFICSTSSSLEDGNWIPLLVKENCLNYPLEFLHRISSRLKFYGELKQIPVSISGENKSACILCRVIGFLNDN